MTGCVVAAMAGAAISGFGAVGSAAACARRTISPFSVLASTRRVISRSAMRANISASGVGGSAPKYRSSAAKSRKYSAIAFIVPKESSNPSSVHEKVPYDTVRILLDSTIIITRFLLIPVGVVYHQFVRNPAQAWVKHGLIS